MIKIILKAFLLAVGTWLTFDAALALMNVASDLTFWMGVLLLCLWLALMGSLIEAAVRSFGKKGKNEENN